jgi:hypothetical protein
MTKRGFYLLLFHVKLTYQNQDERINAEYGYNCN